MKKINKCCDLNLHEKANQENTEETGFFMHNMYLPNGESPKVGVRLANQFRPANIKSRFVKAY